MKLDTAIIYVTDLEAAIQFYIALGLKLEYKHATYASFAFENGSRIGLNVADSPEKKPGYQTIILGVDDAKNLYEQLKNEQLKFSKELTQDPWGLGFVINDPDGSRIEVIQRNESQK